MFHSRMITASSAGALLAAAPELKELNESELMAKVKEAIAELGKGFEEFKLANDVAIKELKSKGANDVVLTERIDRIAKSLDDFSELKADLEKKMAAERKEREELELRLNRPGGGEAAKAAEVQLKSFNSLLGSISAEKSRPFSELDAKGYEEYCKNFKQWLRYGEKGQTVDVKTMSVGSDPDGGYWVTPDTSGQIVKKIYETSEIRQIANVTAIGTNELEGIEDLNEAGAAYADEHAVSGNVTTPQIGKWKLTVWWIDTEPKTTQQLLDDSTVDVEAWLSAKVGDKIGRFENAEFCTGAAKIKGFAGAFYTKTADTGSVPWGEIGFQASGAAGDFTATTPADKLIEMIGLLKNAYLANARWVTRRSVITKIRKFKDGNNQYLWQPSLVLGAPELLLAYPVTRAEDMPALAADSFSLAFGDFRAAYQIVDRQGIRVLRDPYTAKPYVKFYTTKRTGGGVVNFEAIKLMKFAA